MGKNIEKSINRLEILDEIKESIKILVICCSTLKVLNNAFIFFDNGLLFDLSVLQPAWVDYDVRFSVENKKLSYIDYNNFIFYNEDFKPIIIDNMSNEELFKLNLYFEKTVSIKSFNS